MGNTMVVPDDALVAVLRRLEKAIDDTDDAVIAKEIAALAAMPAEVRRMAATTLWPDEEYDCEDGPILHTAAAAGRIDVVERLIAWGADLDVLRFPAGPKERGSTALAGACHANRWDDTEAVCLALIRAGAALDRHDFYGLTPLHYAAAVGSRRLVEALIAAGADPDARDARFGRTPLHAAAEDGNTPAIPLLIAAGATVDAVSDEGDTPLLEAVALGWREAAEALTSAGADPAAADPRGRTGLHFAARHGDDDLVHLLTAAGADLHARDDLDQSPFRILTAFGNEDLLQALHPDGAGRQPELSEEERVAIFITLILQNTTGSTEYLPSSFIDVLHERDRWIVPRGRRLAAAVSALGVGEGPDGVLPCSLVAAIHHIFWYADLRYWCHRDPNDGGGVKNLDADTLYEVHEQFSMAIGTYLTRRSVTCEGRSVSELTRQERAARKISLTG